MVDSTHNRNIVEVRLGELSEQLAAYHRETKDAVRPRRRLVGPWFAASMAWLAAGSLSVIAVFALAERTAGSNDGKIAWVVFVSFVAALGATFIAAVVATND